MKDAEVQGEKAHDARYLGCRYSHNLNNKTEIEARIRGMRAGWASLGKFWTLPGLKGLKRVAFIGNVLGPATSACSVFAFSPAETRQMQTVVCKFLRVMMKGNAFDQEGQRSMSNTEVLKFWRLVPLEIEFALQRVSFLQTIAGNQPDFLQLIAAVWGRLEFEDETLDCTGALVPHANPHAKKIESDLNLFCDVSSAESFFEIWGEKINHGMRSSANVILIL